MYLSFIRINKPGRLIAIALLSITTVSCSIMRRGDDNKNTGGGYYQSDGPPKNGETILNTPDPTPRLEPFSKTGNKPYKALGKNYYPMASAAGFSERGRASWYGKQFHGRRTSSGETYDMYKMTAAHPTLPLPTYVQVHNLDNGRTAVVRVNDRGPFKKGRIIDLSYAAASKLGVVRSGTARVAIQTITALAPGNSRPVVGNTHSQPVLAVETAQTAGELVSARTLAPASLRHFVQAGTFSSIANAQRFERQLADRGYQPVQVLTPGQAGGKYYKVRVGPIASSAVAENFRLKLSQSLAVDAVVVVE